MRKISFFSICALCFIKLFACAQPEPPQKTESWRLKLADSLFLEGSAKGMATMLFTVQENNQFMNKFIQIKRDSSDVVTHRWVKAFEILVKKGKKPTDSELQTVISVLKAYEVKN
jgi:hypothetical protein